MKSATILFTLLFLLLDPAWSGQEEQVHILIEKNAAGEDVIEINGELINMSEELDHMDIELQTLLKEIRSTSMGALAKPEQAFIGILLEDEDTSTTGVNVIGITPDSPAQSAGIKTGDIITGINGSSLAGDPKQTPASKLFHELKNLKANEKLELDLLRDGQQMSLSLIAAKRGDYLKYLADLEKNKFSRHGSHLGSSLDGVELYPLDKELGAYFGSESGMLILNAPNDKNLPIRSGDVILLIGERSPVSPSQTWRILHSYDKGESIKLTLMRHGEKIIVTLDKS